MDNIIKLIDAMFCGCLGVHRAVNRPAKPKNNITFRSPVVSPTIPVSPIHNPSQIETINPVCEPTHHYGTFVETIITNEVDHDFIVIEPEYFNDYDTKEPLPIYRRK